MCLVSWTGQARIWLTSCHLFNTRRGAARFIQQRLGKGCSQPKRTHGIQPHGFCPHLPTANPRSSLKICSARTTMDVSTHFPWDMTPCPPSPHRLPPYIQPAIQLYGTPHADGGRQSCVDSPHQEPTAAARSSSSHASIVAASIPAATTASHKLRRRSLWDVQRDHIGSRTHALVCTGRAAPVHLAGGVAVGGRVGRQEGYA